MTKKAETKKGRQQEAGSSSGEPQKTSSISDGKPNNNHVQPSKDTNKQKVIKVVASVSVGILLVIIIAIAVVELTKQIRYDNAYSSIARITVDGDYMEKCYDNMEDLFETIDMYGNYCFCNGTLKIPAEVDEDGSFKSKEIVLSVDNANLFEVKDSNEPYGDEISGRYLLEDIKIGEDQYAKLSTSQYYNLTSPKKFIAVPEAGISEVLTVDVTYFLSDEDRAVFSRLEQQRKDRIAEEERIKAEEKARQEEEARAKAEAEAAEKAAQQAWAELTYEKYANQIKVGMTRNQLQEIFDFRGKCRHTSDAGNSIFYDCSGNGGQYSSATFQFNFKTGKLVYKSQYGLR